MRLPAALMLTGLLLGVCACEMAPEPLEDVGLNWVTYSDSRVGYRIDYPDVFAVRREGDEVWFTYNGVPARVVLADEQTAADRGLWPRSEPAGSARLAGRAAARYVYRHWDGPSYSRTIAYVMPFGDRQLALEFRTPEELTSVQKRMLASFQLTKTAGLN